MIIAQEILHSMEKKKGRYGIMVLKIDLENLSTVWNGVL